MGHWVLPPRVDRMPPSLAEIEKSISSVDTFIRWTGLLTAVIGLAVAFGSVRYWRLQSAARPLREAEKRRAEERIASLNEQTARLENDSKTKDLKIAELQSETAAARLEAERLRARMRPRSIPAEYRGRIAANLRRFAGLRYWVTVQSTDRDKGSEQVVFSNDLKAVLSAAGWLEERQATGTAPSPVFRPATSRGVEVGYPSGSAAMLEAAQLLVAELEAANIEAVTAEFTDIAGIVLDVGVH